LIIFAPPPHVRCRDQLLCHQCLSAARENQEYFEHRVRMADERIGRVQFEQTNWNSLKIRGLLRCPLLALTGRRSAVTCRPFLDPKRTRGAGGRVIGAGCQQRFQVWSGSVAAGVIDRKAIGLAHGRGANQSPASGNPGIRCRCRRPHRRHG
jgi:hypothetical protein